MLTCSPYATAAELDMMLLASGRLSLLEGYQ